MPTIIWREWDPKTPGTPPHMSPEDELIWRRLQSRLPPDPLRYLFDVGLGAGAPLPPDTPPDMKRMWLRNTQQRADVILEYADHVLILELRSLAQTSAIGRLLSYQIAYGDDPIDNKPAKLALATDAPSPIVAQLAARHGIIYYVV